MPAVLRDFLRSVLALRNDRRARTVVSICCAVLYLLVALPVLLSGDPTPRLGVIVVGAVLLIAGSVGICVARPAPALVLASVALVMATLVGIRDISQIPVIAPYLAVLLPVLAGSLDPRSRVRTFALAVAALTAAVVIAWGYAFGVSYSGRPGVTVSAVLVCAAPVAIAAVWRRPPLRLRVVRFLREQLDAAADVPVTRPSAVWVAVGFYLACVVADLVTGTMASVLTAAPVAAALVWWRQRPDLALGLTTTGLALTAIIAPLDSGFGVGEAAAVYSAAVPIFGALIDDAPRTRRLAYGVLGASALLASLVAGSVGVGLIAVVIGGVVAGLAWAWRQNATSGHLRVRLRESERRGRVAERGVQVEQERTRIAREVHDVVAHSLAVVIAQADGARFAAETKPTSVAPALEAIADTARAALGEVRTMLHDLRTVSSDGIVPGPADIDSVITTVRALGIEVESVTFGRARHVTDDAGLALFRIAQEAMTNALRHGDRRTPITVEIDWGEQAVVLAVMNGVPDDVVPATERPGHGIPGMIERAALVGGECTAGVGSNGRFRVRASLPVLPTPDPKAEDEVADAFSRLLAAGSRAR